MISVTVAVERDRVDFLCLCALRELCADQLGGGNVATVLDLPFQGFAGCACFAQRNTALVINDLRVNMMQTAEDRKPRALAGALHQLSNALLTTTASYRFFNCFCHMRTPKPTQLAEKTEESTAAGEGLTLLTANMFAFVPDTLALVRLGLANLSNLGGELADHLLVRSLNQ